MPLELESPTGDGGVAVVGVEGGALVEVPPVVVVPTVSAGLGDSDEHAASHCIPTQQTKKRVTSMACCIQLDAWPQQGAIGFTLRREKLSPPPPGAA